METTAIYPVDCTNVDYSGNVGLRSCDMCGLSIIELGEGTEFWFDSAEGLSICDECMDAYLREK